jgi:hypothetical protein
MVRKNYYKMNDTHPYFDNFYYHVWRKHFPNKLSISHDMFYPIINEELSHYNARYKLSPESFIIEWDNESDYLLFVLKWA